MTAQIIPFRYAEARELRTVTIDGEPWFVANDVTAILNIGNTSQALSYLDDDERGVITNDTLGGGWTEQTPPYQLGYSKDRAPPFWDNKESQRM